MIWLAKSEDTCELIFPIVAMKPENYTNNTIQVPASWGQIAEDLRVNGYSIVDNAIELELCLALGERAKEESRYKIAGIGRSTEFQRNDSIRTDEIYWIERGKPAHDRWIDWSEALRLHLNQELLLGLFSFESHFAHYSPGGHYATHLDAFRGQANRVLSLVLYLNESWTEELGGQLILYPENEPNGEALAIVPPRMGTLVVFLSEEFPHEVKPTKIDRYSIAGWYRINTSKNEKTDPPR